MILVIQLGMFVVGFILMRTAQRYQPRNRAELNLKSLMFLVAAFYFFCGALIGAVAAWRLFRSVV
jgi:multisubunit Na+/H+ antiporter MnhB subunit